MTRQEYDRYRIIWRPERNVISVYEIVHYRLTAEIHIPIQGLNYVLANSPYAGHIIEWLVNFQPN